MQVAEEAHRLWACQAVELPTAVQPPVERSGGHPETMVEGHQHGQAPVAKLLHGNLTLAEERPMVVVVVVAACRRGREAVELLTEAHQQHMAVPQVMEEVRPMEDLQHTAV